MSGKKTKKPGNEDVEKLIDHKSSKRKLARTAKSSEDEENKRAIMLKKKKLSQNEKQENVRSQKVLKCDQHDKNICEQAKTKCKKKNADEKCKTSSTICTEAKYKKTKNSSKKAQVNCSIQVHNEENASHVIRPKSQKRKRVSEVCDELLESVSITTNVLDSEASSFVKCENVSGNDVSIQSFNEEAHDESSGFESPKKKPKQSVKKCDSSFHVTQITESMSHENLNDVQNTLLVESKQKKRNSKTRKNSKSIKKKRIEDFKLKKKIKNKKLVKRSSIGKNKNLKLRDDLICIPDVEFFFKSENSDASECQSTQNSCTSEKDVDYLPSVRGRNSKSKKKQTGKKKNTVKKKGKKSDMSMNKTNKELVKGALSCLVKLVRCSQTFMDKRNKLFSSNILHAQKYLFKKPLISESTLEKRPKSEDLAMLLLPEKYEVQKSSSSNLQIIDSDFAQLPQPLQDYFVLVTKAIFYTERHAFKYAMNDVRQSICLSCLSPYFYKMTVEGIKKFFPERFYLERIFDVVSSLIENHYFRDLKEQFTKEIINLLLDYLIIHSPASVQYGKRIWSTADPATNFLVRVLRKCETFSEEMYNSILLYLETLFQDTSKQLYFYYNALTILIAFGPLAVFQVLSKNFLPFYNHLSKYLKCESKVGNFSQHEALLVYGHLRSAVELLIKHCSNLNYFKRACFLKSETSSLSDANQNIHKQTKKIFGFILSTNILQYFGDSLSSRLPLSTNCFVNNVPLSHFAVQLEKKSLAFRNAKQLSGKKNKIVDCTENFSEIKCENSTSHTVSMKTYKKSQQLEFKNSYLKKNVQNKHFNYLNSGVGNLYLFL